MFEMLKIVLIHIVVRYIDFMYFWNKFTIGNIILFFSIHDTKQENTVHVYRSWFVNVYNDRSDGL